MVTDTPLTIAPDALIERLEARYAQAMQAQAAEQARMVSEIARLETALTGALEQLRAAQAALDPGSTPRPTSD